MKLLKYIIIIYMCFIPTHVYSNEHIIVNDIRSHMDYVVGNNNYTIHIDKHNDKHYWIEIFHIYDITLCGNIVKHSIHDDTIAILNNKLKDKYPTNTFSIVNMPHMPESLLNELHRKASLKVLLLFSLLGVILLFISVIIIKLFYIIQKDTNIERHYCPIG